MPSGTRQSSTQTVQVPALREPGATGTGRGSVEVIVDQSMPSRSMMWVPSVTVPERTAVPPELAKTTVTFSHQRRSVASRVGALQVRAAGEGAAEEVPGRGEFEADGSLRGGGWAPLSREEEGAGDRGEADGPAAELAVSVVPGDPADPDAVPPVDSPALPPRVPFAPSSGTSVTDPVGRADVLGVPPAAPTAV